jgi:hypothetical protein
MSPYDTFLSDIPRIAMYSLSIVAWLILVGGVSLGSWRMYRLLFHGYQKSVTSAHSRSGGDGDSSGESEAGKPVPVNPAPTHHLQAAKDLPPSDKTHSLPKD